jgi:hypothetical protein
MISLDNLLVTQLYETLHALKCFLKFQVQRRMGIWDSNLFDHLFQFVNLCPYPCGSLAVRIYF